MTLPLASRRQSRRGAPGAAVPPRGYGGTELVVHELARGLARAGHDVTLFATGDSEARRVRWIYRRPVWPPDPAAEVAHCRAAAAEIARGGFDLVSCRNTLIYFDGPLQQRALGVLCDAIAPGGFLWLGEAEWPAGGVAGRLALVNRQARLFRLEDRAHA
jgi:hypothetical protein